MNLNNMDEIVARKYEKHLSIFGQKVLSVLIQQNTKDDISGNRIPYNGSLRHYSYNESSKENNVIDFVNYNLSNEGPYLKNRNDLSLSHTASFETPAVPKSNELVKCVNNGESSQTDHQDIHFNSPYYDIVPVPPVSCLLNTLDNEMHHQHNETPDNVEDVPWDDMFDTELLSDINNTDNRTSQNCVQTSNTFKIEFPDKPVANKSSKTRETKTSNISVKKPSIDIVNVIPKKVKKPEDRKVFKPNYRKQKYSKSVKNWLNDVDPANPVDDEGVPSDANVRDNDDATKKEKHFKIALGNTTAENNAKKTVQSQLANRNGIMKYCKPKIIKEVSNINKRESIAEISSNKARAVKSKFIPPIKSQLPVKELTYDITTIVYQSLNDSVNLFEYNGEEMGITLIYRNGFCQLNKHHSEDVDVAQGIMIVAKDKYYHIPNSSNNYRESLQTFMNNNSWVCYEGKHVITHLVNQFGISIDMCNSKFLDVKVGGSLLDPDNPPNSFSELQKLIGYVAEFTVATECGLQKTAWYLMLLQHCWQRVRQALHDQGLWKLFVDIEMRVLPIISDMERVGVCVNMEKLRCMEKLLMERMKSVEQACHRAAGRVFQLTSPQQLRAILYDELRLDSHCNLKIRETISKGAKSTSETMLRSLMHKHPLPKLILEYRHLHKAHSTFLLGIAQCVRDGVIRPVWEQNAAATGRIACNTPNLQAVPKAPFNLTLFPEDGAEHAEEQALNLRSVYESREGWLLVAADFRQVECRLLALAAGDAALLAALRGPDLFTRLAATWLGKEESAVSDEERERTKRVVYASMYGAGPNKLADVLGLGYERALEVAAGFNRTFPSLKGFGRAVVARCEREGALRTPSGRARRFTDIASPQAAARAHAERKAVNFIIQGSAADVCKTAMVCCVRALAEVSAGGARLLLQIHDELVWEVREELVPRAAAAVERAMSGCGARCGVGARLPVALRCGRSWGHMQHFAPQTE